MTETTHRRRRRPTLAYALTQARKAGFVVTSATIAPDSSVLLDFGKPGDDDEKTGHLDKWMAKHEN
jgi:hypothetical protein